MLTFDQWIIKTSSTTSGNNALRCMLATLFVQYYVRTCTYMYMSILNCAVHVHVSPGPRGPYSACVQPTGKPWIAPIHGMYTADYLSHRSTCLTCPTCRLVWLPLYVVRTPSMFLGTHCGPLILSVSSVKSWSILRPKTLQILSLKSPWWILKYFS